MEKLEDKYPELKNLVELTRSGASERDIHREFDKVIHELKPSPSALKEFLDNYVHIRLGMDRFY